MSSLPIPLERVPIRWGIAGFKGRTAALEPNQLAILELLEHAAPQGLSSTTIAELSAINPTTIRTQISRLRRILAPLGYSITSTTEHFSGPCTYTLHSRPPKDA